MREIKENKNTDLKLILFMTNVPLIFGSLYNVIAGGLNKVVINTTLIPYQLKKKIKSSIIKILIMDKFIVTILIIIQTLYYQVLNFHNSSPNRNLTLSNKNNSIQLTPLLYLVLIHF